MKKHILIFTVSIVILFSSGCASLNSPQQQNRLENAAYIAAEFGTAEGLRAHPEWRGGFEQAVTDLKILEAGPIDLPALLEIVHRLPVKELKSDRAALLIDAATLLLTDQLGTASIGSLEDKKPVVIAIRKGIERGLSLAR